MMLIVVIMGVLFVPTSGGFRKSTGIGSDVGRWTTGRWRVDWAGAMPPSGARHAPDDHGDVVRLATCGEERAGQFASRR